MYQYAITFRIANKTVGGKSYDDRYEQLLSNLREEGFGFWDETTSFALVESRLGTYELGKRASRGLSQRHDLLFLFDPEDMSACYFGAVEHEDVLLSFFPNAKKLE